MNVGTSSRTDFAALSAGYFSGNQDQKAQAALQYQSLSGPALGYGHAAQETSFLMRGDGSLQFLRRGDFGERGDCPPGLWRGTCTLEEVEQTWSLLSGLHEDSFPSRAADPGDAISVLTAAAANRTGLLAWGPPDRQQPRLGNDFLAHLGPIMGKAIEETIWSVEMTLQEVKPGNLGTNIRLAFKNPGVHAIHLLIPPSDSRDGFIFRYMKESSASNTTALGEWTSARALPMAFPGDSMIRLEPNADLSLELTVAVELDPTHRYSGKVAYYQMAHFDHFAGLPVLTGACFTEILEFTP